MRVAILGTLEISDGAGRVVEVTGARLRSLLVRLAIDADRPVSVAVLAETVWGADQPADVANALQTLVSRLRRTLGDPAAVVQSAGGYRLAVAREDVDAHLFESLAAAGSTALAAGDADRAADVLREALALWRGPALADGGPAADVEAARLHDLRTTAMLDRASAELALGSGAGTVADLEANLRDHPLDERATGLLMTALTVAGRQAEALAVYERTRARLANELGVDPSAALQAIHLDVLRGEIASVAAPAAVRRTNLKAQLTSFVGRDEDVARIQKSLEQNRLVTLVGPGGAGKTRLASEAVAGVLDDTPDGVWFVELASVTDAGDIAQTVLGSLGIRETHLLDTRTQLSARDATTRLLDVLVGRRSLVVLDNCEHLVEGCAGLADHLLAQCADLRIVATSREPLGIVGEALHVVAPLGRPRTDETASEALGYPAVRLFADRAAAVQPDFSVDDRSVGTVIDIVTRLDGLPLAIELAAARLRALPLEDIRDRLSDRFRLLTGGSRTALPRHRTLRAVVEWSWELLTPAERLLAERLAVFPAGATNASAAAVCSGGAVTSEDVPDLLASLVDKSLLQRVDGGERLRMLETIREYGIERLAERGDLGEIRGQHARYFAELVREADQHIRTAGQLPWMRLVDAERDNVLAALRHLVDVGDAQQALEVAVGIGGYWMFTGAHAEAAMWMTTAREVEGAADDNLRLLVDALLVMTATATSDRNDPALMDAGLDRLKELNERFATADTRQHPMLALMRPVIAMFSDEPGALDVAIEEALQSDDPWVRAASRMFRANIHENNGDVAAMRAALEIAHDEFIVLGERWGLASCLQMSGQVKVLDGNLDGAAADYRRALDLVVELGTHDDQAWLNLRLGEVEVRRGNFAEAIALSHRGQELSESSGSLREAILGRIMLADIARRTGDEHTARETLGEVLRRIEEMPPVHPMQGHAVAMVYSIAARHELIDDVLDAGRDHLARGWTAAVGTRDQPIMALVGVTIACYTAHDGDYAAAARQLGATHRLRGSADPTHPDVMELTAQLRERLGAAEFEVAYADGQQLDRDVAIELLRVASGAPAVSA